MASNWPKSKTEFMKWFYEGQNGNELLQSLNQYAYDNDKDHVRRERYQPCIYGIVLNKCGRKKVHNGMEWKYVKVGFTHKEIKKGTNNRMEQVQDENDRKGWTSSTLFVLPIGCVNTTEYRLTENNIRRKVGVEVDKKKAKEIGLPNPTEWVFTSQEHIDKIKEMNDDSRDEILAERIHIFKYKINEVQNDYYIGHRPDVPTKLEKYIK